LQVIHGKEITRLLPFFTPTVTSPAGLNTAAAEAAFAAEVTAEKAQAGVTEAEGTVDKSFQFHTGLSRYGADLPQCQFPRQNYPLETHILKLPDCQ
jgi:hypothetical protein